MTKRFVVNHPQGWAVRAPFDDCLSRNGIVAVQAGVGAVCAD